MYKKYRKKPVIIEAIQWTGKNLSEIDNFMGGIVENKETTLVIHTLEGDMEASFGDYIIKGVNGEFYPCKPDIFAKTYEEVTEQLTTLMGLNISNMEDKDIMSELKLEYRNNIVYFNGLKINAYTAEGMRLISNLLKKGLYEIGKELENVSNSK